MEKKGISGSTLKLIAIITMLIDHVGAAVLARLILGGRASEALYQVYVASRAIGRIAFPIFCFLLVEGFEHTRDRKRYVLRLGMFALISEIPFDLVFSSRILEFGYQNVFFTLFIGLLTIMAICAVEEKEEWNVPLRTILTVCIAILGMGAASLLRTDYASLGVLCILALYISRKNRVVQILAGCLAFFWWELPALIAFLPIAFYNGKRGWNIKYLFYLFYPVHLALLYLLCCYLGIAQIPAM